MDLAASSAVNLTITSASLRLVVLSTGGSIDPLYLCSSRYRLQMAPQSHLANVGAIEELYCGI
jgi:hypothetical protein